MSAEAIEQQVRVPEINCSMGNMIGRSTLWSVVAPIGVYAQIAEESQYSGIEYLPITVPHYQLRMGLVSKETISSIKSAHQSFRTERTLQQIRNHPNPTLAAMSFVTMAEKFDSLKDLTLLQEQLGPSLPVVVYPPNKWMKETDPPEFLHLNKLIQPAPELLDAWGVSTVQEFISMAKDQGYDICLDTFHIRRKVTQGFATQFPRWSEAIPRLLQHTREIHLALGRTDFEGIDSMQELKDIFSGERQTDIVPILELVRDSGWSGPIVTEIPADSACQLVSNSKVASPETLITAHQQIVNSITEIMTSSH